MPFMRPWTREILRVVEEGITCREEIIRTVIPFVPQGHAFRAREIGNNRRLYRDQQRREADGVNHAESEEEVTAVISSRFRTATEIHRIGARRVIRETLHSLVQNGYLIREGEHFRLAPEPRQRLRQGRET